MAFFRAIRTGAGRGRWGADLRCVDARRHFAFGWLTVNRDMCRLFLKGQLLVLLDRQCISEDDDRLKSMSIASLAGILKWSREMLLLWENME